MENVGALSLSNGGADIRSRIHSLALAATTRRCFLRDSAVEAESTRRFDGFDRLPFDMLRVCDTAGRLKASRTSRGSRTQLRGAEASTAESLKKKGRIQLPTENRTNDYLVAGADAGLTGAALTGADPAGA